MKYATWLWGICKIHNIRKLDPLEFVLLQHFFSLKHSSFIPNIFFNNLSSTIRKISKEIWLIEEYKNWLRALYENVLKLLWRASMSYFNQYCNVIVIDDRLSLNCPACLISNCHKFLIIIYIRLLIFFHDFFSHIFFARNKLVI